MLMKVKWKSPMKYNFFCDENITRKLQKVIKRFGYQVDSVRNQSLFGINNGNLVKHLNDHNFTLITFDKDFFENEFIVNQGVIVLDVNPNRDEFTVPLLEKFLIMVKDEKINFIGKKILLNRDFFFKFK